MTAGKRSAKTAAGDGPKAPPARVPLTVTRPELLTDGSDRDFRRLVHGFFAFAALHEAIRNSYADYLGMGGIQYTVLLATRHLSQFGDVNVRDVAEYLRSSASFITVETRKLQQLGLLEKRQSQKDRRRVSLKVTEKGGALLNRLAPLQQRVNNVQFDSLGEDQFKDLLRTLEKLIEDSESALKLLSYLKEREPLKRARGTQLDKPEERPERLQDAVS